MPGPQACKRCLLRELTRDDYFRDIYEYIESLDELVRTPLEEYERRLGGCRECDHLLNGMCELCGCFVEVRAAKKNNRCAHRLNKW